jgi:hypothetical protein
MGTWTELVIQADETNANCFTGVLLLDNSSIVFNWITGVRGWSRGLQIKTGSIVTGPSMFISACRTHGCETAIGGAANLTSVKISGCSNSGLLATTNSTISADSAELVGLGSNGLNCSDNSCIDFEGGIIKTSTNNVLYAFDGGVIIAESEDVSATQVYYDSTATCSPARNTEGNGDGIMRGGPY